MSKESEHPPVRMPTLKEDRDIRQAAKSDPDAQPLTAKQLQDMKPARSALGRPKSSHRKLLVSVRYSPEVISFFKSTGSGWQSRMDMVLRDYVERHSHET